MARKKKETQPKADKRKDRIFDVIVRSYIETAEPVGSRTISRHSDLGLSPASIRNVMADLEEEGFLKQPHTSAGRVPTDKGYRYWVDRLMEREELKPKERDWIRTELSKAKSVSGLKDRVSKIIMELTENAALVYFKNLKKVSFLNHLLEELIKNDRLNDFFEEEAELFIEGACRVFEQPEFQDLHKMRLLLQAFDDKDELAQILLRDLSLVGVQVHIGGEGTIRDLDGVSIVAKDCYLARNAIGSVAVVGPTRMKYAKVVSVIEFVADSVTDQLERF